MSEPFRPPFVEVDVDAIKESELTPFQIEQRRLMQQLMGLARNTTPEERARTAARIEQFRASMANAGAVLNRLRGGDNRKR